ncbi:hypothetical protein Hthe01_20440 [Hydrogenophilus thermoluteolus]|uniref:hypothetical protein n=1 Tax=Hydrogenophilus thermoluteolus TaxID=297 RepID=UPI0024A538E2|nr:hypothetical protein [Hydrogenophilus thermoluteolus]GLW61695.1 hypothetical protein Hthe01_20440 [Hydrogenophilus thermoluteolus]
MYGVIDLLRVDTEPGASSAFAPPAGFKGDGRKYVEYMRERWKKDPCVRQHVAIVGRLMAKKRFVFFRGPYALEAKGIVEAVMKNC